MSSIWTVRRSTSDVKLTGLCGGVAEHWGVDPVLVRVAWVLLALSGGVGVVLYVAGWLLIPVQGQATAPVDDLLGDAARRWPKEVWVALVLVACVVTFTVFGGPTPFGVGPALVIGAIWYFGFAKHRQPQGRGASSAEVGATPVHPVPGEAPAFVPQDGPTTPFTLAAEAWRRRIEEHVRLNDSDPAPITEPPDWPAPPAVPAPAALQDPDPELSARTAFLAEPDPVGLYIDPPALPAGDPLPQRRGDRLPARRLRLLTLLVLGLTTGGLALADHRGLAVPPVVYAASALLIVGLALVAATWWGRARGLLALGLLLVPVVTATAAVGPHGPLAGWGSERYDYTTVAELPPGGNSLAGGELVLDLSGLTVKSDAVHSAHVGTGRLEVVVPRDANVTVNYVVDQGAVEPYQGKERVGSQLVGTLPPPAPRPGAPTLTLNLSVHRGQLEVRQ